MKHILKLAIISASAALLIAGCKKTDDNTINYKSAINTYYEATPACIWDAPKQFPHQVTTADTDKTTHYDALFDQGLLTRTTGDKKALLGLISKQVTNYDLSDKGRAAWTADTTQPGFGNFCYGHRSVSSIDSSTPTTGQPGATTVVTYHYTFASAPDWARATETQTAFPQVQADLTGGVATATLVDTSNGWRVAPSTTTHKPATGSDGKIVE